MIERSTHSSKKKLISAEDYQPLDTSASARRSFSGSLLSRPITILIIFAGFISVVILWFLLTAKVLILEVTPAGASVSVTGGIVLQLSGNYLLRPGDYRIMASARGYVDYQADIKVTDAGNHQHEISLQKKPGHLSITSVPSEADVFVNGHASGQTPLTVSDLSPGHHTVRITATGYFPETTEVDIEGLDTTQAINLTLKPAWGQVNLASQPSGAIVTVGDEDRGTTPVSTQLLSGGEQVSISLAGYKPWRKRLSVAPDATLTHELVILQPLDGLLAITSVPKGAGITVDGNFRGTGPADLQLIPDQDHQISLFLDGYHTEKRIVQLRSGEERKLVVNLSARTGSMRILTSPKDAEVWIDGELRGTSDVTVSLPAKAHRMEVRKEGHTSKVQTITPQPDFEQVLRVSLMTHQQTQRANLPGLISSAGGQKLKLFRPEQTFTMGASRREAGRRSNEVIRNVRLERAFYLALTEVTNAQFKEFSRQHSSSHAAGRTLDTPSQPVVSVSWQQAALYCNWLSVKEGLPPAYRILDNNVTQFNPDATGYRMPTEAEWSWAARYADGQMAKYTWGSQFPPTGASGNYADSKAASIVGRIIKTYNDGFSVSAPVGSFPPNGKGLFDLGGNVSEWVSDYYGIATSLSAEVIVDPPGPDKGKYRVVRGASWRHGSIVEMRLSYRDYADQGRDDVGFRIARYAE